MKAIIAAAGWGTRMLPITKVIPKELMPVGEKPVIQYIVEGIVGAGINEIAIITSNGKEAIQKYFDKNYELEDLLAKKGKLEMLDKINQPKNLANLCFYSQKELLGFGHGVLQAKSFINDEYFLLSIGDTIFSHEIFTDMIDTFNQTKKPVIVLQEIPKEKVEKYGVVEIKDGYIKSIVEKPKVEEAPSNLIISGLYILPRKIFDVLANTGIDTKLGEILLTDAIQEIAKGFDIVPMITKHKIRDIGNFDLWLQANNEISRRN